MRLLELSKWGRWHVEIRNPAEGLRRRSRGLHWGRGRYVSGREIIMEGTI